MKRSRDHAPPAAEGERKAILKRTKGAKGRQGPRGAAGKPHNGAAALRRAGKDAVALRAVVAADADRHARTVAPEVADYLPTRVCGAGVA